MKTNIDLTNKDAVKTEAANLIKHILVLDERIQANPAPTKGSIAELRLTSLKGQRAAVGFRLSMLEPVLLGDTDGQDFTISTVLVEKLAQFMLKTGLAPVFVNDKFTGEFTDNLAIKNITTH